MSFEIIPRILSENCGLNVNEIIPKLKTANKDEPTGIDIDNQSIRKISEIKVYDHMRTKWWAIKLATDAAVTILKVDQIIISKPAGGPKMKGENKDWDQDWFNIKIKFCVYYIINNAVMNLF